MDGSTPGALADDETAAQAAALAAAEAAADAARQERMSTLREMRQMGMRMARHITLQSLGPEPTPGEPETDPPQPVAPESVLMFSRLSNAVRLIVALEEQIDARAWARAHPKTSKRREWRNPKQDVLKRIISASVAEYANPRDTRRLMGEMMDTLEDPGLEEQFLTRRMADIATEVCEGMGIRPHLRHFTDEELDYKIIIDRSHWPFLPKLPKGMVGTPGIPSAFEMDERAAGRPWPPHPWNTPPPE
jgi:hypothetical protein